MPTIGKQSLATVNSQKSSAPSYYKKGPDPKTIPRILPPGQMEIRGYLTREFTVQTNVFDHSPDEGSSQPPTTSKRAKAAAKLKANKLPRFSEAALRADLNAEEERRKEYIRLEKKMRKRQEMVLIKKKQAEKKSKEKLEYMRGKQPEGQSSLVKFGFTVADKAGATADNNTHE